MIKIEDINICITALIRAELNLKVYDNSVKQSFKRPSFFMQIMPISINAVTKNYSEKLMTVELVYFSKGATDLENIQMYDKLYEIFSKPLAINDREILPRNIRSETNDGGNNMTFNSLSFKFDLNYLDDLSNKNQSVENMDKLTLNLKGGN